MIDDGRPTDVAPGPGAICPFLLAADGGWRSATALRDHRCTAVTPPAALAAEKQRRLCLTAAHAGCATFQAALDARDAIEPPRVGGRVLPRTTPVVLDHGRLAIALPVMASKPHIGQGALIGVLAVAFTAVLVARLAIGGGAPSDPAVGANASPTPTPSATAGAQASVAPVESPSAEPTVGPSASPTLVPTETEPTPEPAPTSTPATYTVKSGDTLSAIAARFGTTVKKLAKLNEIEDPSRIRVGQVLILP